MDVKDLICDDECIVCSPLGDFVLPDAPISLAQDLDILDNLNNPQTWKTLYQGEGNQKYPVTLLARAATPNHPTVYRLIFQGLPIVLYDSRQEEFKLPETSIIHVQDEIRANCIECVTKKRKLNEENFDFFDS